MRIKLEDQDVENLIDLLDQHDCLTQWEIDVVNRTIAKLKRAKSASLWGPQKALYLEAYKAGCLPQYKALQAERKSH